MSLRVPPWLLDQFPWLADLLPVLTVLRELWHDYQGLFVVAALWFVHRQLRKERILLSEKVGNLSQIVKGIRDDAEAGLAADASAAPAPAGAVPAPQQQTADGANNWDQVREIWRELRDRLELTIENVERARARAKYANIPRYGYRRVIKSLEDDEMFGASVADKLMALDRRFGSLKFAPGNATSEDVKLFRDTKSFVDKWLPKLPPESPDKPAPSSAPQLNMPLEQPASAA